MTVGDCFIKYVIFWLFPKMTAILNVVKEDEVSVNPLLSMYEFHCPEILCVDLSI